jgi:hypothetical protein
VISAADDKISDLHASNENKLDVNLLLSDGTVNCVTKCTYKQRHQSKTE